MTKSPGLHPSAGAVACLLLLGAASGGVDVESGPKAVVQGTIAPEGEVETFRFDSPAGAGLSFTLSATRSGADVLGASLTAPSGGEVDLHGARKFTEAPRKIVCRTCTLPETGTYTMRVTAGRTGAYKLVLSAAPPASARGSWDAVDPGAKVVLQFAAPAGAGVTLTAKAPARSQAVPRLGLFDGTDLTTQGKATPKSHVVKGIVVPRLGLYTLEVSNAGSVAGGIDVTAAIRPPAVKSRKVDVRGVDGAGTNVDRVIDAESGGEVAVGGDAGPLSGCVLTVPPGALAADTRITVGTAAAPFVADPATQQPAGPAVELGPSGTTFSAPVTVRIPFDPTAFPRGSDPATTLRVVRREADGTTATIVPAAVLAAERLCEFETDGFSSFVAVAPTGPPSVAGRSYWAWRFASAYEDSPTDTRGREFRLRSAIADFGAGTVDLTGEERTVAIDHTGSLAADVRGHVTSRTDVVSSSVPWQYVGVRDPAVLVAGDALAAGEDGAVLLGTVNDGWDVAPDVQVFVQRPAFPPTAAQVQGLWWVGRIAVEPAEVAGRSARVVFRRTLATLDLRAGGVVRITGDDGLSGWDPATDREVGATVRRNESGTWAVAGPSAGAYAGAVDVVTSASSWRLLPGRGGEILAGTDTSFGGGVLSFVVAVRKSSGRVVGDIDATYAQYSVQLNERTYPIDGVRVGDWATITAHESRWHRSSTYFDYTPHEGHGVQRSETTGGLVLGGGLSIRVDVGSCDVSTDGFFRVLGYEIEPGQPPRVYAGQFGAITPDLSFGFTVWDPVEEFRSFGMRWFVRVAPHETPPDGP